MRWHLFEDPLVLSDQSQREGNCSWSRKFCRGFSEGLPQQPSTFALGKSCEGGMMLIKMSGNAKLVHLSHLGSRMYTQTLIYIYIYIHIRTHIHIHCRVTQICVYIYIYFLYTYIHIIMYIYICTWFLCMCVCVIRYWCTDAYSLPQRTVYN